MKRKKAVLIICCSALFFLILDTKTVVSGAAEGIRMCLRTVIPSLFPFFIITSMLNDSLLGMKIPLLRPVNRLCSLPEGSESVFLLGILGGYPVGARCVAECFRTGQLDRATAHRLLGFCSNCGPAFIFGICGRLFSQAYIPWILWGIQIAGAILVGIILPPSGTQSVKMNEKPIAGIQQVLRSCIMVMGEVCGWIILFRILLTLADRWIFWIMDENIRAILSGVLELANGCVNLGMVSSESLRFIFCACFLSFGGLCVGMQTVSVTGCCGTGLYFPGKVLQTLTVLALSVTAAYFLYPGCLRLPTVLSMLAAATLTLGLSGGILGKKGSNPGVSVV